MFRPRLIPVLLLKDQGLVKSVKFKDFKYVGDPINAVKIFNDLNADELVFLDIEASKEKRCISSEFVKDIGEEANMPFAVGGGINTIAQIQELIACGAEKVILNTVASLRPEFVKEAADVFGSSTISVCIDVKKNWLGKESIYIYAGKQATKYKVLEFVKLMQEMGAGELIIQSVDNDGAMAGYDIELLKRVSEAVTIPVIALGGAGNEADFYDVLKNTYCTGLAAGSFFTYQNKQRNILINYPEKKIRNVE